MVLEVFETGVVLVVLWLCTAEDKRDDEGSATEGWGFVVASAAVVVGDGETWGTTAEGARKRVAARVGREIGDGFYWWWRFWDGGVWRGRCLGDEDDVAVVSGGEGF